MPNPSPVAAPVAQPAPQQALPPALQKALARVTEISSLPEVTTRIVAIVEDPKSTAQELHDLVRTDPALASKILKVVNSAFYGLPSQISNLDRAIVMLGMSAVKNIALAASLTRLFRPGPISDRFNARDLWTHCIAVGVCARMLAEAGIGHAEEAFVAGLVHDLGLLVEHQAFPHEFRTIVETCSARSRNFQELEREQLGADHQAFGAALATKWKFPSNLRHAISHHHNPEPLKPDLRTLVTAVQVADVICCQNEIGFCLTARDSEVTEAMLEVVRLDEARISAILASLNERIQEAQQIFTD